MSRWSLWLLLRLKQIFVLLLHSFAVRSNYFISCCVLFSIILCMEYVLIVLTFYLRQMHRLHNELTLLTCKLSHNFVLVNFFLITFFVKFLFNLLVDCNISQHRGVTRLARWSYSINSGGNFRMNLSFRLFLYWSIQRGQYRGQKARLARKSYVCRNIGQLYWLNGADWHNTRLERLTSQLA